MDGIRNWILLPVLLLFIAIPGAWADSEEEVSLVTEPLVIVTQAGKKNLFNVELARTNVERVYGLMYRQTLPEDSGMLFVFPEEEVERSFWMKNTFIPLDILFIKDNGLIHHIHENAIPHDLTPVSSQGPVSKILELNGGMAKKLNIRPGDTVYHALFGNKLAE